MLDGAFAIAILDSWLQSWGGGLLPLSAPPWLRLWIHMKQYHLVATTLTFTNYNYDN